MTQGTVNGGDRGNVRDRRRRREWLVTAWRADVDLDPRYLGAKNAAGFPFMTVPVGQGIPACRCFRCGGLLTADTVSPDRMVPGCQKTAEYPRGGTYVRKNLRPACLHCQSVTGNEIKRTVRR